LICWHVLYIKYEFSIRHHTEVSFVEDIYTISDLGAKRKAQSQFWESSRTTQGAKPKAQNPKRQAQKSVLGKFQNCPNCKAQSARPKAQGPKRQAYPRKTI